MSNEEKAVQNAPITETKEEQQKEEKKYASGLAFLLCSLNVTFQIKWMLFAGSKQISL